MKREPMLMPSAPSASAATRPRVGEAPEAIIGMSILIAIVQRVWIYAVVSLGAA
jgi:hypothetical protein